MMMKPKLYTLGYSSLHCGLFYSATYMLPFLDNIDPAGLRNFSWVSL